jgi:hypothetical protein
MREALLRLGATVLVGLGLEDVESARERCNEDTHEIGGRSHECGEELCTELILGRKLRESLNISLGERDLVELAALDVGLFMFLDKFADNLGKLRSIALTGDNSGRTCEHTRDISPTEFVGSLLDKSILGNQATTLERENSLTELMKLRNCETAVGQNDYAVRILKTISDLLKNSNFFDSHCEISLFGVRAKAVGDRNANAHGGANRHRTNKDTLGACRTLCVDSGEN